MKEELSQLSINIWTGKLMFAGYEVIGLKGYGVGNHELIIWDCLFE